MEEFDVGKILDIFKAAAEQREMLKYTCETLKSLLADHRKLQENFKDTVQDLEAKLKEAQKLYYGEKQKVSSLIKERNRLLNMLEQAKDIVNDRKLNLLPYDSSAVDKLETIVELDNTDYLMSELSYTMDEEDLSIGSTDLNPRRSQRKRAPSGHPYDDTLDSSLSKKTKGKQTTFTADRNEQVIATTTVTVPHNGPVTATSVIETLPPSQHLIPRIEIQGGPTVCSNTDTESVDSGETPYLSPRAFSCRTNMRIHDWNQKSHIMGEACSVCTRKIKFSSVAFKCSSCKGIVHTSCKDKAPLPCVPVYTPNSKSSKSGSIADFVPQTSPMVPAIVIHCIREIESRGLNELGLYRVPGSDKEVKSLKDKLIKAKGVVQLSDVPDINTVCGCLKEFLRSLKETLIPQKKWKELAAAAEILNGEEKKNRILTTIHSLPQPNRDTLSYIVLHLQKVAASHSCKMPVTNLSKMFGPSIVGYSKNEPDNILNETNMSNKIMAEFLLLPTECWEELLYQNNSENVNPELVKTPSQNSLLAFFTDSNNSVKTVRKVRKYFNTP